MCLMIYLGSNRELRARKEKFVSVELLTEDQAPVREFLPEAYRYFIGSHSGCSCGFPSTIAHTNIEYFDGMFDESNESRQDDIASVRALLSILDEALATSESCTIYPVWNGAESAPPKGDVKWNRSKMNAETFVVTEQFRYKILAEQNTVPEHPIGRY